MTVTNNKNSQETSNEQEVKESECLVSEDGHHHSQPHSQSHACKYCGKIF
jgi:hypothetical protein